MNENIFKFCTEHNLLPSQSGQIAQIVKTEYELAKKWLNEKVAALFKVFSCDME